VTRYADVAGAELHDATRSLADAISGERSLVPPHTAAKGVRRGRINPVSLRAWD
jgi:hypothetical protein